eukprot:TRINITY_DN11255_c0_g1_i1.p1 TRINITY_DN11255_c0_g1~~TRINITY_DN11255_c0_g1_i1.p1  ORF type:complete len:223 (-),score=30.09 TRINITY_DN11255_c0_g1_i1:479-1147(-)
MCIRDSINAEYGRILAGVVRVTMRSFWARGFLASLRFSSCRVSARRFVLQQSRCFASSNTKSGNAFVDATNFKYDSGVNTVSLLGRLTKDPVAIGEHQVKLRLYTKPNYSIPSSADFKSETTRYTHSVRVKAKSIVSYISMIKPRKGEQVFINGSLQHGLYENPTTKEKQVFSEVVVGPKGSFNMISRVFKLKSNPKTDADKSTSDADDTNSDADSTDPQIN